MAGRALKVEPKTVTSSRITSDPDRKEGIQDLNPQEVAARSYELWLERGSPIGSPEVDWFRAEEELRNR
jgi:Protein of unknown function (DUF2934)